MFRFLLFVIVVGGIALYFTNPTTAEVQSVLCGQGFRPTPSGASVVDLSRGDTKVMLVSEEGRLLYLQITFKLERKSYERLHDWVCLIVDTCKRWDLRAQSVGTMPIEEKVNIAELIQGSRAWRELSVSWNWPSADSM